MYKEQFQKLIEECTEKFFLKGKAIPSYSEYEDFDYQSSILFSLNKNPKKQEIIESVVDLIKSSGNYSKVEVTGNGFLCVKVVLKNFNQSYEAKEKKKIVIDYCGANIAKKMHIGHIRSMFIGDFITRLNMIKGNTVYRFNHVGDWGNQFGFLLQYIHENKIENFNNEDLTNIYKKAHKLNEIDESFKKKSEDRALALQHKDPETIDLWGKCCSVSLNEMQNIFSKFNLFMTEHDAKGESFYAPMCKEVESLLLDKGIARQEADGSIIVPDENPNKSPLIIKKSTGSYLYAMYDLVAIYYRVKYINPDEIIYVVDKRQELHFKQVFAAAMKMGWSENCKFKHIAFGTILGKDKKPLKTRSGESLYLDILLEDGFKQISEYEPIKKIVNQDYKEQVIKDTLFGALKFYDLHFSVSTDYIFDWDSVLSIKGNSAPYMQNAFVRIDSIFFMNNEFLFMPKKEVNIDILNDSSKALYFQSQKVVEVFHYLQSTESHVLTNEVIALCKCFHAFYENNNISNAEKQHKENFINLLKNVVDSLTLAKDTLGINFFDCIKRFESIQELNTNKVIQHNIVK